MTRSTRITTKALPGCLLVLAMHGVCAQTGELALDDTPPPAEAKADDDTPSVETETTVDDTSTVEGFKIGGDLRPIYDYLEVHRRNGETVSDEAFGIRWRAGTDYGITESVRLGGRLAGLCFVDACDMDFVMESATPASNGLELGQFTVDELYLHWFRRHGSIAVGRLQTRFVLRSGVFAKSLDRNDSNNVNVTWTDGMQATYRARNGWDSSFVLQLNDPNGTGSIRRDPLDFDDSQARATYFVGFQNTERWGNVVQRSFDVSYLPASLLKDGDADGRREDYWGFVGRLVGRWPQRREGIRLRSGIEMGYAPETQTPAAAGLDTSVDGLAWDVVVSLMDFQPGHSIGVNYAQTGAGWLLSPQFRPNEELFEIRYMWRGTIVPLLEIRVRRREDLEQPVGTGRKREVFDGYIRMTWEFGSGSL